MKRVRIFNILFSILVFNLVVLGNTAAEERFFCDQINEIQDADEDWELAKDEAGIKVYTRKTLLSPIKVFRGVMEIDVDFSRLVALIWDDQSYIDWLVLCSGVKRLNMLSETEQIIYVTNALPWPLLNRDAVMNRTISQDPETLAVTVEMCLIPDYMSHQEGYVRVPLLAGYGKMTPLKNGKVELIYEVLVDAGGKVPTWIQNFGVVETPHYTLNKIKKLLPLEKYKDVRYGFITYPEIKGTQSQVAAIARKKEEM